MADRETNRVEAFSDGVFAISITLLIAVLAQYLGATAGNGLSFCIALAFLL
jgi:uncharacterized membrane protein